MVSACERGRRDRAAMNDWDSIVIGVCVRVASVKVVNGLDGGRREESRGSGGCWRKDISY